MTYKLLLFFFLIWVFLRFMRRIFLPLTIFHKVVKNAKNQRPFSNKPFSRRGEQKKDFSAIQDAVFDDLSKSESSTNNKDSAKGKSK